MTRDRGDTMLQFYRAILSNILTYLHRIQTVRAYHAKNRRMQLRMMQLQQMA